MTDSDLYEILKHEHSTWYAFITLICSQKHWWYLYFFPLFVYKFTFFFFSFFFPVWKIHFLKNQVFHFKMKSYYFFFFWVLNIFSNFSWRKKKILNKTPNLRFSMSQLLPMKTLGSGRFRRFIECSSNDVSK